MRLLSRLGLSSLHGLGSSVGQITCDPLWGIGLDGAAGATSLISTLKQRMVSGPVMELLPKKVKMCVWSAYKDRVLGQFNDIGIKLTAAAGFVTLGGRYRKRSGCRRSLNQAAQAFVNAVSALACV